MGNVFKYDFYDKKVGKIESFLGNKYMHIIQPRIHMLIKKISEMVNSTQELSSKIEEQAIKRKLDFISKELDLEIQILERIPYWVTEDILKLLKRHETFNGDKMIELTNRTIDDIEERINLRDIEINKTLRAV